MDQFILAVPAETDDEGHAKSQEEEESLKGKGESQSEKVCSDTQWRRGRVPTLASSPWEFPYGLRVTSL